MVELSGIGTADPLRARQVLSQLSYSPILLVVLCLTFTAFCCQLPFLNNSS